jgi:hypothetical protein
MLTESALRKVLEALPGVQRVEVVRDSRLIATVVSDRFQPMYEGQRQQLVWSFLRQSFDEEQLRDVEFIFTLASEDEGVGVEV